MMKKICFLLLLFTWEKVFATDSLESLRVDITPLLEKGCKRISQGYKEDSDLLQCTSLGLKEKFGCDQLLVVPDGLGGLSPSVPMVECRVKEKANVVSHGVRTTTGRFYEKTTFIQYILYTNGKFLRIDTPEDFRSFFAPITSPEEAFSLAHALTDSYPIHKIQIPTGGKAQGCCVKPSFARKMNDGYLVHLFEKDTCQSCPSHAYRVSAVDYLVTTDGIVESISASGSYEFITPDHIER